jgi:UDP-N-acetylmuramoyl-L-alanyl-D-glutamate--2,6-diaminopimelate ligase
VTLSELVTGVHTLAPGAAAIVQGAGKASAVVTAVVHDSRAASKGAVFVAIRGQRSNGAEFARQAVDRGALAVVAEEARPGGESVLWLPAVDARLALAELSSRLHGHPSERLTVVGVTGTNGKTTVSYLMASVFDAAGRPCGRIGTVTFRVGPNPADEQDASHTTPEASEVQGLLAEMLRRGCTACAMEVSSHALVLHRVANVRFAAAIFTNLTRDHLDFHGDMQQYFEAKRRLFDMLPAGAPAIVNVDDPRGLELSRTQPRVVTYAIDRTADVQASAVESSLEGLSFTAQTPRGAIEIRSPLVGRPNVYNLLAVTAAAIALDIPTSAIQRGLAELAQVPGRFQVVSTGADDVRVVVDYAHTDDALKNLLETARALAAGRIVTVFGCGGDRDRTKRPLMGAVAARLSDLVILTSDNPRSEDPERIIDEIKRGIVPPVSPGAPKRPTTPLETYVDRRVAIEHAISTGRRGDLILIAGKGHEKYQVIGNRTLPFDDVEVARAALGARRGASKA